MSSTIFAVAPKLICKGEAAVLFAFGATNYTWSNGQTGSVIAVSPTIATSYTLIGKDIYGCPASNTISVLVKVSNCTDINDFELDDSFISVSPNPNTGDFIVKSPIDLELQLMDASGKQIGFFKLTRETDSFIEVSELPDGMYFLKGMTNNRVIIKKMVIMR